MTRSRLLTFLGAALALSSVAVNAPSADAAATFTQVSLSAIVTGQTVRATTTVKAVRDTVVQRYGICVRDVAGAGRDFTPKKIDVTIGTSGVDVGGVQTLPAGTYWYFACLRVGGQWSEIGARKTFTVDGSTPSPSPTSGLLFADDFTGPAGQGFDTSKWGEWSACTYNGSAAYGDIDCGVDETLDGQGHLRIPADPKHGSSISTKDDFGFTYGEVSAWIKTPAQVGYWPAFWTLNNNADGHDTLPLGEADVMESYTTWPTIYHRGTHNWNNDQTWGSPDDPYCGNVDLSAAFHKYSARFEPGKITFSFDDHVCGRVEVKQDGGGKPYGFGPDVTRPNWLILTLAVGGAGGQQKVASDPAVMLVDRVEVTSL